MRLLCGSEQVPTRTRDCTDWSWLRSTSPATPPVETLMLSPSTRSDRDTNLQTFGPTLRAGTSGSGHPKSVSINLVFSSFRYSFLNIFSWCLHVNHSIISKSFKLPFQCFVDWVYIPTKFSTYSICDCLIIMSPRPVHQIKLSSVQLY